MKQKFKLNKKFSIHCVSEATVRKVAKSFPSDEAGAGEIPVNVLKNSEIWFFDLTNCINEAIINNKFPDSIKLSDVTSVYKRLDSSDMANYRPVSVLPLVSKVFDNIIYDQVYEFLENFLSELLCSFRKAHSTQYALFRLIQKWQAEFEREGYIGTILMDFSKAYDCSSYDLLIAKVEAYALDVGNLNFLLDYLNLIKPRTKVNCGEYLPKIKKDLICNMKNNGLG